MPNCRINGVKSGLPINTISTSKWVFRKNFVISSTAKAKNTGKTIAKASSRSTK